MKVQFSRRTLIGSFGFGSVAWKVPTLAGATPQALQAAASPQPAPLNRFPRMVQEYFVEQVRESEKTSLRALSDLKNKADAEAHVRRLREKILRCFGPFPEKTPLNARVTGVVERDMYRIEKIIFESRPDFLVTANLYIPKKRPLPLPGVVGTCGHITASKACEAYQSYAQALARLGYVCLIFDPIGQGERLQYLDFDKARKIGPGVGEHLYAGNQQCLVGEYFGAWRAWDGIRALDYLLTRPEVDPRHVGVTGNSGGGTMTTWLCGLERRWTMAAPSCFVTTFRRNMENEIPTDPEQCPPHALALGLDEADFIAAMAPKPVILLGKEKDGFDVRGIEETYGRLKRLYGLLGAPQNIELFVGPTYHGFSKENREAMYRWFNHVTGISDARTEPELALEPEQTLLCTQRGQVAELKSKTIFAFTKAKADMLASRRPPLQGQPLVRAVTDILRLPSRQDVADYRILRTLVNRGFPKAHVATYMVETERGISSIVYRLSDEPLFSRPPRGVKRAILYVSHRSADEELRSEPLLRELLRAEPESAFYACDVRGIGESQPDTCGLNSFLSPYGSDFLYASHGIMLDRPYIGQRTHDVLAVLDWLQAQGHSEVHLAGKAWGAVPAAFAALLAPLVVQVTLKNALTSYTDTAQARTYRWPLALLVPGILEHFDLPDCYRAIESKQLRQIDPWGPDAA